ncbi:hypothetical protein PSSHI_12790 [Photobacterium sp. R1]
MGFIKKWMCFFAAPSMVYHYVEKHSYLPPQEFVEVVMAFDCTKKFTAQKVCLNENNGLF